MDRLKPWQIVLLVVAAVVLGGSLWISLGGSRVPNPSDVIVADVESGDLYVLDTSGRKIVLLPATNPETGARTLFPVRKEEDGSWVITGIVAGELAEYEGPAAAVRDRGSRIVEVTSENPRRLN